MRCIGAVSNYRVSCSELSCRQKETIEKEFWGSVLWFQILSWVSNWWAHIPLAWTWQSEERVSPSLKAACRRAQLPSVRLQTCPPFFSALKRLKLCSPFERSHQEEVWVVFLLICEVVYYNDGRLQGVAGLWYRVSWLYRLDWKTVCPRLRNWMVSWGAHGKVDLFFEQILC